MSILDRIDNAFATDLDCNTDKVILLAIARHADETGVCWLSWRKLADITNRSRGAVWRALRRLSGAVTCPVCAKEKAGPGDEFCPKCQAPLPVVHDPQIIIVKMFDPTWHGVQRSSGYILTSYVKGEAGEICPAKLAAVKDALLDRRFSRQRDGEGRVDATVRVASTRPLEVIPVSGPIQPTAGEIGESGSAAPFPEGGEDETQQQLQQPTDAAEPSPIAPELYNQPAYAAWLDCIGELTDKQMACIAGCLKNHEENEVLRVIGAMKAQIDAGKSIAKPARYLKVALEKEYNRKVNAAIGAMSAGHRTAKQPPAAGHRNQVDRSAVAEETNQVTSEEMRGQLADAGFPVQPAATDTDRAEAKQRQEQERAEWQQREEERKEKERKAAELAQIEREHQRAKSQAAAADAERRKVAGEIVSATGADDDTALRMADDFLRETERERDAKWWQEKLLDSLRQKRALSGKALTTQQATAILHRALLDTTPAPAKVTA